MNKINYLKITALLALGLLSGLAAAHTPLCSCYDNGDGTVECEGGFSDGSSAAGVKMLVLDAKGATVHSGKMDANSGFTFKKPAGDYTVRFDAGEGHGIDIPSKKIVQ